jgi:pheromone a factor receptor
MALISPYLSNYRYIFQELLTGGDLFSFLEFKGGKLNDVETTIILRQILEAVRYMHSQGVVHRDLKPDNILLTSLTESARIVITDFGSARFLPQWSRELDMTKLRMFSLAGTTEFAAPYVETSLHPRLILTKTQ